MLSHFELPLNTVVKIRRKEKVVLQNAPQRTPKQLLNQKYRQKVFIQNLRILDKCAFAHCKIGIRGQQLPVIKKKFLRK